MRVNRRGRRRDTWLLEQLESVFRKNPPRNACSED